METAFSPHQKHTRSGNLPHNFGFMSMQDFQSQTELLFTPEACICAIGSIPSGQVFQEKVPLGGCSPQAQALPDSRGRGGLASGHRAQFQPLFPEPGYPAWALAPTYLLCWAPGSVPKMYSQVWWPCSFLSYIQ